MVDGLEMEDIGAYMVDGIGKEENVFKSKIVGTAYKFGEYWAVGLASKLVEVNGNGGPSSVSPQAVSKSSTAKSPHVEKGSECMQKLEWSVWLLQLAHRW